MSEKVDFRQSLEKKIQTLGFDFHGIASVEPSSHMDFYLDWLDDGSHGEMQYLARKDSVSRRSDLTETLPSAQTALVVAQNYFQDDSIDHLDDQSRAIFARYARGEDYHDVMGEKLKVLHRWLNDQVGKEVDARSYVDTGPILERELAQRAGIGWFGKNTMLINPRKGSFFFLGVLLWIWISRLINLFRRIIAGRVEIVWTAVQLVHFWGETPMGLQLWMHESVSRI